MLPRFRRRSADVLSFLLVVVVRLAANRRRSIKPPQTKKKNRKNANGADVFAMDLALHRRLVFLFYFHYVRLVFLSLKKKTIPFSNFRSSAFYWFPWLPSWPFILVVFFFIEASYLVLPSFTQWFRHFSIVQIFYLGKLHFYLVLPSFT